MVVGDGEEGVWYGCATGRAGEGEGEGRGGWREGTEDREVEVWVWVWFWVAIGIGIGMGIGIGRGSIVIDWMNINTGFVCLSMLALARAGKNGTFRLLHVA